MKPIYLILTCALSLTLISCNSSKDSTSTPNAASSPNQEPAPTETQTNTPSTSTPTTKLYNASVSKKGLDYSYEAEGKVSVVGKTITVAYENQKTCDNGNTFRQQWEELFNLDTNTWTSRSNKVSDCLQSGLPEDWIEVTPEARYAIATENNETVIKADALEEDGTVIVENTLVVRYGSSEKKEATTEAVNSAPITSSEADLTASDPNSRITLRANPSENSKSFGYGLVGDRVQVIEQATTDDYTWYKVRFPRSGAVGWIRGDFVRLITNQIP
jgi:hypothetical protein